MFKSSRMTPESGLSQEAVLLTWYILLPVLAPFGEQTFETDSL